MLICRFVSLDCAGCPSGSRPRAGAFLLGPNAARVSRYAECSVLVVRN